MTVWLEETLEVSWATLQLKVTMTSPAMVLTSQGVEGSEPLW